MPDLIIVKSLLVRVFLFVHALVCAWRVVETTNNSYAWVILVGLIFLVVETVVISGFRHGREYRVIAFSLIFYLTCTVPSLWIIHLNTANRKLFRLAEIKLNQFKRSANSSSVLRATTPLILSLRHIDCHDQAWQLMEEQHWLDAIQETMFIVLAITRLLISCQYFPIEQSGLVLVLTLMNTADLLSISHALQYHDVIIERFWMYIGLVLLTILLFQFAFIDTDGLTPIDPLKPTKNAKEFLRPLIRSLFIHDGLLLIYRLFLILRIRCGKSSIIFFFSKNLLMMFVHLHRVYYFKRQQTSKTSFSFSSSSSSVSRARYQFYGFDQNRRPMKTVRTISRKADRLLHGTLHRLRRIKTTQTFSHLSSASIFYPFARRRIDAAGRARTAFALYGLPFPTRQVVQPATISSISSHLAKTLSF